MRFSRLIINPATVSYSPSGNPNPNFSLASSMRMIPYRPTMLFNQVLIEYELGEFNQGEAHLQQLIDVMSLHQPGPSWAYAAPALAIPMVARITRVAERLDIAEAAATTILSSPFCTRRIALVARASLGLMAVLTGNVEVAREHYAALKSAGGTILTACLAIDRLLGLVAQAIGQLDEAVAHFEDAYSFCRAGGQRPELAWTCHDYADTLLQRNDPGDRVKAISLLGEALSLSRELGMQTLMEQVAARQERIESLPPTPPAYPDGLTQREVEVLRLIALGRSNPAIAQELFISPNTVAHHVTNILNKTNTANRTEAATYAGQHGLL
jgi:DNA-binding CsgD family transcriptional regulator